MQDFLISLANISSMRTRIKFYREQLKLTQKEFADYLGYDQAQISRWERGRDLMSVQTLWLIYQKLKIDFPYIHLEDLLGPE